MICLTIVWLLVVTYTVHGRVITVNNDGIDSDECCGNGTCPCRSLSRALQNLTSHAIINITSASVSLGNVTQMGTGPINNITITGNDITIRCNNVGAIYCASCSDITIEGITFDHCGHYPQFVGGGLGFINVRNVTIKNCTFQNSTPCAVTLNNANGNITIKMNNFISNLGDIDSLHCSGLGIFYGHHISTIILDGNNFYNNGYPGPNLPHTGNLFSAFIGPLSFAYPTSIDMVIRNTAFVNNTLGLFVHADACSTEVHMSNLYVCSNSERGISVYIDGCQNYQHHLSISSSSFVSNVNSLIIRTASKNFEAIVEILNSTFLLNKAKRMSQTYAIGALSVVSSISKSEVTIINCKFLNNLDGAIVIHITPPTQSTLSLNCSSQNIRLSNVLVYNTTTHDGSDATDGIVYIRTEDSSTKIAFEEVQFELNRYNKQGGGVLLVMLYRGCDYNSYQESLSEMKFDGCTFIKNTAFSTVANLQVLSSNDNIRTIYYLEITNANFDENIGGDNIVHFYVDITTHTGNFKVASSNFTNNIGTTIVCFAISHFELSETVQFVNNSADSGAAIYIEIVYDITIKNESYIYFTNNSVRLRGGAMYIDVHKFCINSGVNFNALPNDSSVVFVDNSADLAGNSIYFNIPKTCNVTTDNSTSSLLHIPNMFNYFPPPLGNSYPIVTSPLTIKLHSSTVISSNEDYTDSNHYFIHTPKMLGEIVSFTASVYDYFNHSAEPTIFHMRCDTCGSDYFLSKKQISVASNSLQEFQVFPSSLRDVDNSTYINITFASILPPLYKQFGATLTVKLSPCQRGHHLNILSEPPQCVCYPRSDIVQCNRDYSEIKIGYWVGNVSLHYASSLCPNNYCNFAKREESSPGYFELPSKVDEQCMSHRTGVACGKCSSGHTLAYDSPDCINNNKCSAGITVLVVLLTIIYWVVVVAIIFGVMYFNNRVLSGYVYGIIYYYSIVDILLGNNLQISESVFQVISIISSFAKLNPQVFGQLCFVEGLSGIDQQFIHYSHAVAVSLITLTLVTAARYSMRIAQFISRCVIRVICLLILLSYTSLASTSLRLLRPLPFTDIDETRTFLSPEIKYFTDRHLVYAIVALFCEALLIGLLLLLLFEPLIRKKITLTRIKPILDQFQGCFKDKYHWFAAYYLICRQVIILIVYVGNSNYDNMLFYLQTACIIIAMIHFWFQPYRNRFLNVLDGIFLLTLVLVVSLNAFSVTLSSAVEGLAIVLVLSPLLLYLFIAVFKLIGRNIIKEKLFHKYGKNEANGLNEISLRYLLHKLYTYVNLH